MSPLTRYFKLAASERRLLLEAVLVLGIVRLAMMVLSFRRIAPCLGVQTAVTSEIVIPECVERVARVRWAVMTAARYVPWQARCLAQALTAKRMLRRRGIASVVYLGVTREDTIKAHAWVKVGDVLVTGGGEVEHFKVISIFV